MKQCKECGKEFEPENPKGVFCSKKCKQKNYRDSLKAKVKILEDSVKKQAAFVPQIFQGPTPTKPVLSSTPITSASPVSGKTVTVNITEGEHLPERLPKEGRIAYMLRLAEWREKTQKK